MAPSALDRPIFDFPGSLELARMLVAHAESLKTEMQTLKGIRDAAFAEWTGPWGREFEARADDHEENVGTTLAKLLTDADEWGAHWQDSANQMNNVVWAEAYFEQRKYLKEKAEREEAERKASMNKLERGWDSFAGYFSDGDESATVAAAEVPAVRKAVRPHEGNNFLEAASFVRYNSGQDHVHHWYLSSAPDGPSPTPVTQEDFDKSSQHGSDAAEKVPGCERPDPVSVTGDGRDLPDDDGKCQMNLTLITELLETSETALTALRNAHDALHTKFIAVDAGCQFRTCYTPSIATLDALITAIDTDTKGVRAVRDRVDPNGMGGVARVDNSAITADLRGADALKGPGLIKPTDEKFEGMPVNSGVVDDPINAANGNFYQPETDLELPGIADSITIRRIYNAINPKPGVFGRGWTSVLDMRVIEESGSGNLNIRLNDGALIPFAATADRTYAPYSARQLRVERVETGWTLLQGFDEAWSFNADGMLTGGQTGYSRWSVDRTESAVVITEAKSGRSVTYELLDGRVQRAVSSDQRVVSYRYDDDDNCLAVDRPSGAMHYEMGEDGRIAEIRDADGVLVCRNTYDDWGRTTSQLSPFGRMSRYAYGDNGTFTVTDDNDGPSNVLVHDRHGNLLSMAGGDGAAMRMRWDNRNRMIEQRDRNGAVTRFGYHPDPDRDLLISMVFPDGTEEHREWDDADRVVKIVQPNGGEYRFTYQGDHRLPATIVDPMGGTTTFVRNDQGQPLRIVDADGVQTAYRWNADGQLVHVTNGAGQTSQLEYDAFGSVTRVTGHLGGWAAFVWDGAGRVLSAQASGEEAQSYSYTAAGRPLQAFAANPQALWSIEYGDHGHASEITDIVGSHVEFDFDVFGNHSMMRAADGTEFGFGYDSLNHMVSVAVDGQQIVEQEYDRGGDLVGVTNAENASMRREVDLSHRTTAITDPLGATTRYAYHAGGEIASITQPNGATTSYQVDLLGRPVAIVGPDGATTRIEYSPGGRLLARTSAAGRRTDYLYDANGALHAVRDADGHEVNARIEDTTLRINADGHELELELDDAGRVTTWRDAKTGAFAHMGWGENDQSASAGTTRKAVATLDDRGQIATITDPAGLVAAVKRDLQGRIVSVEADTLASHYTYNGLGQVTEIRDDSSHLQLTYSPAGHVTSLQASGEAPLNVLRDAVGRVLEVRADKAVAASYRYDLTGQLEAADVGDGLATAAFDPYGALRSMCDINGTTTSYGRDADGLVASISANTGLDISVSRSAAGRITAYESNGIRKEAPARRRDESELDEAGRILVDPTGRMHRYDAAGRLVESTTRDGERYEFCYGPNGMMVGDVTPEMGERQFSYNAAGQLVAVHGAAGSHRYDYDQRGRRIVEHRPDGSSVRYVWNVLDRLTSITTERADGTSSIREIAYSGYGRAERIDDTAILWDDVLSMKPIQVGGTAYFRSGNQTCAIGGEAQWTMGTTDDPYGVGSVAGVGLGFLGELTVDGLVLMGERVYDPATRQFLSKDPAPLVYASPAGANSYQYAHCDPINNFDPTGRTVVAEGDFDDWNKNQAASRWQSFTTSVSENKLKYAIALAAVVVAAVVVVGTGGLATPFVAAAGGLLVAAAFEGGRQFHSKDHNPDGLLAHMAVGAVAGAAGGGFAMAGKNGLQAARIAQAAGKVPGGPWARVAASRLAPRVQNALPAAFGSGFGGALDNGGSTFLHEARKNAEWGGWNFSAVDPWTVAGATGKGFGVGFVGGGAADFLLPTVTEKLGSRLGSAVTSGGTDLTVGVVVDSAIQGIDPNQKVDVWQNVKDNGKSAAFSSFLDFAVEGDRDYRTREQHQLDRVATEQRISEKRQQGNDHHREFENNRREQAEFEKRREDAAWEKRNEQIAAQERVEQAQAERDAAEQVAADEARLDQEQEAYLQEQEAQHQADAERQKADEEFEREVQEDTEWDQRDEQAAADQEQAAQDAAEQVAANDADADIDVEGPDELETLEQELRDEWVQAQ